MRLKLNVLDQKQITANLEGILCMLIAPLDRRVCTQKEEDAARACPSAHITT